MSSTTEVNHDLFVQVLAQIERDPETWNQRAYAVETACGTAHCFAGWAAVLVGGQVDFSPTKRCLTMVGEPLQTSVLINGESIEAAAENALGIDGWGLFACENTVDDLYRISAEHMGIDEQVLRDKVADVVGVTSQPEHARSGTRHGE